MNKNDYYSYDEKYETKSPSHRTSAMFIDEDECSDNISSQEFNVCEDDRLLEKYKRDVLAFD